MRDNGTHLTTTLVDDYTSDMVNAMSTRSQFAIRLKALRARAGMTQAQLAEDSGLSEGGIKQLESGRNEPSFETLLKLARALKVPLSDFDPDEEIA